MPAGLALDSTIPRVYSFCMSSVMPPLLSLLRFTYIYTIIYYYHIEQN
jgi:hypothetical protein